MCAVLKDGGTGPPHLLLLLHHCRAPLSPGALRHNNPPPLPPSQRAEQHNEAQSRERTQPFTHHFNTANSYNRSELYTMRTREKEPPGDASAKERSDGGTNVTMGKTMAKGDLAPRRVKACCAHRPRTERPWAIHRAQPAHRQHCHHQHCSCPHHALPTRGHSSGAWETGQKYQVLKTERSC